MSYIIVIRELGRSEADKIIIISAEGVTYPVLNGPEFVGQNSIPFLGIATICFCGNY
jgi:hypothetical protein